MSPARRLNDRHPYEVYLLTLAFLSSLPTAAGVTSPPNSITSQLPGWPARLWAYAVLIGAATALVGLAWKRPRFPLVTVTGLLLEQVGIVILGAACTVYAVAVMFTGGTNALFAGSLTLAFGLASFAQARKIKRVLDTSRQT